MTETFSFDDPMSAIEDLAPDIAKLYRDEEATVRALAKSVGLEGEAYTSLMPKRRQLKHQQAAEACISHVMKVRGCSKAEAIRWVAFANPRWFREAKFSRYTTRLRQTAHAKERTRVSTV